MINTSWPRRGHPQRAEHHPGGRVQPRPRRHQRLIGQHVHRLQAVRAHPPNPASGTVNDQPPAPSSSTRSRNMACRSSKACNTTTTSASVTPAGACTTTVWLNCSTGPSTLCSQRMIGVATTGPTPSSTSRPQPSATVATPASRATVCSTKMSRGPTHQAGGPRPRHHLHRQNAVAAQVEERVVDPDPLQPEDLGVDAGQDLLDRVEPGRDSDPRPGIRVPAGRGCRVCR